MGESCHGLRGLVLLLAGLITLTVPEFSERMLQWVVVVVLVMLGASTLWSALRSKPMRYPDIAVGIVYMVVGVGLAMFSDAAVGIVAKTIGLIMAIVGLVVIMRALRRRRSDINWTFNVVRGAIYIAAGLVVALLPGAIASSLILAAAAVRSSLEHSHLPLD